MILLSANALQQMSKIIERDATTTYQVTVGRESNVRSRTSSFSLRVGGSTAVVTVTVAGGVEFVVGNNAVADSSGTLPPPAPSSGAPIFPVENEAGIATVESAMMLPNCIYYIAFCNTC